MNSGVVHRRQGPLERTIIGRDFELNHVDKPVLPEDVAKKSSVVDGAVTRMDMGLCQCGGLSQPLSSRSGEMSLPAQKPPSAWRDFAFDYSCKWQTEGVRLRLSPTKVALLYPKGSTAVLLLLC